MNFIKVYFRNKLALLKTMWSGVIELWEYGAYGWWTLALLWSVFCSVVGTILIPFDLIFTAVCYGLSTGYRECFDNFLD